MKGKGKTHDGMPKDSFKYVGYPDTAPLVVDMFTETAKMKQCMGVKGGAAEHSPEAWGVHRASKDTQPCGVWTVSWIFWGWA